jgi:hypothetical protein
MEFDFYESVSCKIVRRLYMLRVKQHGDQAEEILCSVLDYGIEIKLKLTP